MKQLNLSGKLAILVAVPLVAMLFFSGSVAWKEWQVWAAYRSLDQNSEVLIQIGNVVHQLQRERGRSAVFINSKGEKMAKELPEERLATDAQVNKLEELLKSFRPDAFGGEFVGKYNQGLAALSGLKKNREGVSALAILPADSMKYYTGTVADLLQVVVAMSHLSDDARIARGIQAYVTYLQLKEQAGIERATLASVFALDKFTDPLYAAWVRTVASQDVFEAAFRTFATPDQIAFAAKQVSGQQVDAVKELRGIADAKKAEGGFGVAPAKWFDASTARIDLMKGVEDLLGQEYEKEAMEIQGQALSSLLGTAALAGGVLLLTVALSFFQIRSLLLPIHACTGAVQRLADGDLNAEVNLVRSDELGILATAVDTCILNLRNLVRGVTGAAKQLLASAEELQKTALAQAATAEETTTQASSVAAAGGQLAASSRSMAQASAQIDESTHSVAAAMEEMSVSVSEVAKNCARESTIAGQADTQARQTLELMKELDESSRQIGKIVEMIGKIADQTNLLALNATIESASAGEAGRGFAVVASEIKELARQSAGATGEIQGQISLIQNKIEHSVNSIGRVAKIIQEVSDTAVSIASAAEEQSATTSEIVRSIHDVTGAVATLTESVRHSTDGADEVAKNIAGVSEAADFSAKGSAKISQNADNLNELATSLNRQMGVFRIPEEKESATAKAIVAAIVAHGSWKKRLYDAVETGRCDMNPEHVCLDDRCDFGKWLYAADASVRSSKHWECVRVKHAEFHKETCRVLKLAVTGQKEEARRNSGPASKFARLTSDLTQELLVWRKEA